MFENTTIVAICTSASEAGIGVIRLSGPEAFSISQKIFKKVTVKDNPHYPKLYFGKIFDKDNQVDEALLSLFIGPKSYTGEDVAEFSCHGGSYILNKVLSLCVENGAVLATGGEFTKRAFLNGKMDLTKAESVANLISAKSMAELKIAMSQKNGALYTKLMSINEKLINLAAQISAFIDFPEDDIAMVDEDFMLGILEDSRTQLERLISSYDDYMTYKNGIDTVIVGKPNVGKSSLMNLLYGGNASIVTNIAGTTRDVVEKKILIEDITLNLKDTAGIRESQDQVEKIGVDVAKNQLNNAGLIIGVFDNSTKLDKDDYDIIDMILKSTSPHIILVNKSDLTATIDKEKLTANFGEYIQVSANIQEDKSKIGLAIKKAVNLSHIDENEAVIANLRQKQSAQSALNSVILAMEDITAGMTLDAVGVLVAQAIDDIFSLTGQKAEIAVVDKVFENFCVGK